MSHTKRVWVAAIACVAAMLGTASCGGGDSDSGGTQTDADSGQTTGAASPSEGKVTGTGGTAAERMTVATTINGLYDAVGAGDSASACKGLARVALVQLKKDGKSCEKTLAALMARLKGQGVKLSAIADQYVVKVKIKGNQALATVKFSEGTGPTTAVREDGEWKLNTAFPQ